MRCSFIKRCSSSERSASASHYYLQKQPLQAVSEEGEARSLSFDSDFQAIPKALLRLLELH